MNLLAGLLSACLLAASANGSRSPNLRGVKSYDEKEPNDVVDIFNEIFTQQHERKLYDPNVKCVGTPFGCSSEYLYINCNNRPGCKWELRDGTMWSGKCVGSPQPCSYWDGDDFYCRNHSGCIPQRGEQDGSQTGGGSQPQVCVKEGNVSARGISCCKHLNAE